MFHFLGFLFVIVLAILLIGLTIIGSVFRKLFGLGRGHTAPGAHQYNGSASGQGSSFNNGNRSSDRSQQEQTENQDAQQKPKKLFDKDDGEYVDFEEIKE